MDLSFVRKAWDKWISTSIGSSGEPLKAALLINYDPTGPSRLLSTIDELKGRLLVDFDMVLKGPQKLISGARNIAEQEGIKAKPIEVNQFLDFIKRNNFQSESFFIGQNQYMVTSIYDGWFCARCMNTSHPAGEGAIVIQTASFVLVALYDGSIGSASRAMVVSDQFAWQLGRKNL